MLCCVFLSCLNCLFFFFVSVSLTPPLSALHFGHPITRRSRSSHSIQSCSIQCGLSRSHSNYILSRFQSCCSAECCFQTFLGPPPNLIPDITECHLLRKDAFLSSISIPVSSCHCYETKQTEKYLLLPGRDRGQLLYHVIYMQIIQHREHIDKISLHLI